MRKLLLIALFLPSILQGMFVPVTRGARTYIRGATVRGPLTGPTRPTRPIMPTIQKRGISTPEQVKQFSVLSAAAKNVSPVLGAPKYAVLPKIYATESNTPKVRLVQTLFFQQVPGGPVTPTALKSNAAFSLNFSIIGLIIGALETNTLNNTETRTFIITQWRDEHKNITGSRISLSKVNDLLDLIEQAYQDDKHDTRAILLSFLWAKANPGSNHDWLHYLASLNREGFKVFETGKPIQKYTIPQAPATKDKSVMEKFKAAMYNLKNYIYTPQDYAALQDTLKSVASPEEAIKVATSPENFELAIAAIINKTQQSPFYPPQVIQTYHGYKGQPLRPNCVESATQDLLNIICFNTESKTFDLSLLPATIQPSDAFIHFYSLQNEPIKANFPTITQEFMNLVSNIPGVSYASGTSETTEKDSSSSSTYEPTEKDTEHTATSSTSKDIPLGGNYELKGKDTEQNLLVLVNHFLQTNVTDLESLGKTLSDERRTITFTLEKNVPTGTRFNNADSINMIITNHQNNIVQKAHFYFVSGHGWLDVPERNIKTSEYLLNPLTLAKEYNVSPQAQALLSIQPDLSILDSIKHAMPASFYYIFNFDTIFDKENLIWHILTFSFNNQEATDYAYKLYQELTPNLQINLFPEIMKTDIAKTNKKFENIYKTLQPETDSEKEKIFKAIITHKQNNDEEALVYAYNLYKNLPHYMQIGSLQTILGSGIQKTNKNFENAYKILQPKTNDEKAKIISTIVLYDATNQEAVDYAYSLYKNLQKNHQIHLLDGILKSGVEKTNKNFKDIYKTLEPQTTYEKTKLIETILPYGETNRDIIDYAYTLYQSLDKKTQEQIDKDINTAMINIIKPIITAEKTNEEEVDYAFSLFKKLDAGYYYRFFEEIMTSGIWKTNKHFSNVFANNIHDATVAAIFTDNFNMETIKELYEITDNNKKKGFLTIVLNALISTADFVRGHKKITKISDEKIITITKELLSLGCDVNAPSKRRFSKNMPPLFIVIEAGVVPLLELLIENGAHINEPITSPEFVDSSNKMSTLLPLHFAVKERSSKMIEALLKYKDKVDINAKNSSDPDNSITPLIMACLAFDQEIVKLLLEKGADPNISGKINGKIVMPLSATLRELDIKRNNILTELIKYNVDLNATDSEGNTALDIAIEQKIKHRYNFNNSYETVDILQKAGAQANKKHVKTSEAAKE